MAGLNSGFSGGAVQRQARYDVVRYLFRLMLACVVALNATAAAHALERPLRIRVVGNYPPFYFRDASGAWKGMELEITEAVLKECGYSWELVEAEWARGLKWLETGEIDIMMSLNRTDERETFIDFIGVTKYEQMSLIVRKENINLPVRNLDDLMKFDKPFGCQSGVVYPKLSERIETDPQFRSHMHIVYNEDLNVGMTVRKRMLGFFEDRLFALYSIRTNPAFKELAVHSFSLTKPVPVYLGASLRLDESVRRNLRKAFLKLRTSGTIEKIRNKWTR